MSDVCFYIHTPALKSESTVEERGWWFFVELRTNGMHGNRFECVWEIPSKSVSRSSGLPICQAFWALDYCYCHSSNRKDAGGRMMLLIDAKYSWCYGGDPRVEILPKMEPLKGHPAPSSTVVGLRAWRNCRGRHTDSRLGFPCGNLDHWHLKHALNWKEGSRGHKKANRFSFWAPAGTADLGCFENFYHMVFFKSTLRVQFLK